MRFCMVTTFYPPFSFGGDATYVRALSRSIAARGHMVDVVHCLDAFRLLDQRPVEAEPEANSGIRVHRLRSAFGRLSPLITQQTGHPGLKSRALQRILSHDFDVVHFHNISLVGGPAVLRYSRALVTLYTLHEHWLLCPTHIFWKNKRQACDNPTCLRCSLRSGIPPQLWRYTRLRDNALAQVDCLLSPSEYTACLHRKAGIGPVRVLPLFSMLDSPAPAPLRHSERPRFLFVGRVTAAKGIEPLLTRFATAPEDDLLVIGDGDLLERLRYAYRRSQNIRFLGRIDQDELGRHYAQATALIFPSLSPETFGLSIVEGFACGTPAIVSAKAGGAVELVTSTGGGVVYRDQAELDTAVRKIGGDVALRNDLSSRARAAHEARFGRDRHIDAYLELVDTLRAGKGLPSLEPA